MKFQKSFLILALASPFVASCGGAEEISIPRAAGQIVGDYSLNYYESKKGFLVEDYLGSETSIRIPSEATSNGITAPIVGISNYAFAKRAVKDIYLSTSIHSIGAYAFHQSKLENLYVTPYLVDIDQDAFVNCSIRFNEKDGVKYLPSEEGPYGYAVAFSGDRNATISLPDECEAVYDNLFNYYQKIEVGPNMKGFGSIGLDCKYIFKEPTTHITVTKAGNNSLRQKEDLQSIEVEDCCTSIGAFAFADCPSLTSLAIPDSVTSIGKTILRGSPYIEFLRLPFLGSSPSYARNLEFLFENTTPTAIKNVILGEATTSIAPYTFYGCFHLTSISFPDGLTSIGSQAFYDCSSLASITIPDSVTSIGPSAFRGCTSLKSVIIPDGIVSLERLVFDFCTSLESVSIPNSVTSIENCAFGNCSSLASITIPDSVTSIGGSAFYGCASMESIVIPSGVISMGTTVFTVDMTIYCEASSMPEGWEEGWCSSGCNVVWGYQG